MEDSSIDYDHGELADQTMAVASCRPAGHHSHGGIGHDSDNEWLSGVDPPGLQQEFPNNSPMECPPPPQSTWRAVSIARHICTNANSYPNSADVRCNLKLERDGVWRGNGGDAETISQFVVGRSTLQNRR